MAGKVQQMTKTARKELSDAVERYLIDNPNSTAAEAVEYLSSSFKNISPKNIQKTVQTFFTETPTTPPTVDKWAGYQDELPELQATALEGMVQQPEVTPVTSTGAGTQYPKPLPTPSLRQKVTSGAALAGGAAGAGVGLNSIFGSERFIPAETQPLPPQKKEQLGGPIPGNRQVAAQLLQPEVPEGEKAKEEPKPAPVAPPSAPEGGAPAVTAQPSAPTVDTASLKEPTKEVAQSQQTFPDTIAELINDRKRIAQAFGGGKTVDRTGVKKALESLTKIDEDIKTLYADRPPPQLAEITSARREALQAYKEKANLNEWLSIADRAINAIAQFASAQAAMGTPYVGSYRPSSTDYESRTAQALREYQAEAGLLKEEREESERTLASYQKERDTAAEQLRRGREMAYRVAEEDVKQQQETIDTANKLTQDVFSASISLRKNEQDLAATIEKYRASQAKDDKEAQQKAGKSILELQIKEQQNAAETAQKLLDASNALAANPNDDKALLNYLSLTGKTEQQIQQDIKNDPAWTDAKSIKNIATTSATNAQTTLSNTRAKTAELSAKLQNYLQGQGAPAAPAPTPTPGQQPATRATVWRRAPDGKDYEYYEDTKEPTGKSR